LNISKRDKSIMKMLAKLSTYKIPFISKVCKDVLLKKIEAEVDKAIQIEYENTRSFLQEFAEAKTFDEPSFIKFKLKNTIK